MNDYNDSALDDLQNSLNRDLESLKGHLDSLVIGYKIVSNYNRIRDQQCDDLKKCVEDYNKAMTDLLKAYGDLLTLSLDPKESEDGIKNRIQDKLVKMKDHMANKDIYLQYQIPGEQYVKPTDGESSPEYVDTTDKDLDGVVKKIECIGLNSKNITGDRAIRESTKIYRYSDSSDSSISDTSAKEGAPTTDGAISKQSSADSDSRNTGAGSGNQEETSHEADSTNQTDENRHVLADVVKPLCLIGRERNSDGKYELPLDDERIRVGIFDGTSESMIASFKVPPDWNIATNLEITCTDDDESLSLNAIECIDLEGLYSRDKISYDTWFLIRQDTRHKGTVTYKKTKKPIEYYAHDPDIENAKDVKLEVNWESPRPFVHVVDGKWLYYHPSEDEPHWREESTESVLKYIADYRIKEFERYVLDLYDNMKTKKSVKNEIYKLILTSEGKPEVSKNTVDGEVDSILPKQKRNRH